MKKILIYIAALIITMGFAMNASAAVKGKTISSINSTQLYPLWFDGTLKYIKVTGTSDRQTYKDSVMTYGLDFVVLKYDYPRFVYVNNTELKSACYLVQFVDNLNGFQATLIYEGDADSTIEVPTAERPYVLTANKTNSNAVPSGKFLKYSTTEYKFLATSGESVASHEAYIATCAAVPVYQIVPGTTTAIRRVFSADGTKLSIQPISGGIAIYAASPTALNVYSVAGQSERAVQLNEGMTTISLPKGIYIAGGKKFIVK